MHGREYDYSNVIYKTYEEALRGVMEKIPEQELREEIFGSYDSDGTLPRTEIIYPDNMSEDMKNYFGELNLLADFEKATIGENVIFILEREYFKYFSTYIDFENVIRYTKHIEIKRIKEFDEIEKEVIQLREENLYLRTFINQKLYKPGNIGALDAMRSFQGRKFK